MPGEQPQYLAYISALRQDANSPSSATVRSLDDLIDRFPSLAPKEDSPILDHRPSLPREDEFTHAIGKILSGCLEHVVALLHGKEIPATLICPPLEYSRVIYLQSKLCLKCILIVDYAVIPIGAFAHQSICSVAKRRN